MVNISKVHVQLSYIKNIFHLITNDEILPQANPDFQIVELKIFLPVLVINSYTSNIILIGE